MLTPWRNYVNGSVATQQCCSCQNINNNVQMAKCSQCWKMMEYAPEVVHMIICTHIREVCTSLQMLLLNLWIIVCSPKCWLSVKLTFWPAPTAFNGTRSELCVTKIYKELKLFLRVWKKKKKRFDIGLWLFGLPSSSLMLKVTRGGPAANHHGTQCCPSTYTLYASLLVWTRLAVFIWLCV